MELIQRLKKRTNLLILLAFAITGCKNESNDESTNEIKEVNKITLDSLYFTVPTTPNPIQASYILAHVPDSIGGNLKSEEWELFYEDKFLNETRAYATVEKLEEGRYSFNFPEMRFMNMSINAMDSLRLEIESSTKLKLIWKSDTIEITGGGQGCVPNGTF